MSGTEIRSFDDGATTHVTTGGGGFTIRRQFIRELTLSVPDAAASPESDGAAISPRIQLSLTPTERPDGLFQAALRFEARGMTAEVPLSGLEPRLVYHVVVEMVAVVDAEGVPADALQGLFTRDVMRMMFPALRMLVVRLTTDAGVPPLYLQPMGESVVWQSASTGALVN